MNVLKSMEIQSRHSEMSVISQVSAVEGCPSSGVPLYIVLLEQEHMNYTIADGTVEYFCSYV